LCLSFFFCSWLCTCDYLMLWFCRFVIMNYDMSDGVMLRVCNVLHMSCM